MGKVLSPSSQELGKSFIEHHGIKGQKWGIRNAPVRKFSPEHKLATRLKSKHLSELTNEELKKLNERLNLESSYNRLNPTIVKKGHTKAKEFLALIGTATSLAALLNSKNGRKLLRDGKNFIGPSLKKGIRSIGKF